MKFYKFLSIYKEYNEIYNLKLNLIKEFIKYKNIQIYSSNF